MRPARCGGEGAVQLPDRRGAHLKGKALVAVPHERNAILKPFADVRTAREAGTPLRPAAAPPAVVDDCLRDVEHDRRLGLGRGWDGQIELVSEFAQLGGREAFVGSEQANYSLTVVRRRTSFGQSSERTRGFTTVEPLGTSMILVSFARIAWTSSALRPLTSFVAGATAAPRSRRRHPP